MLTHDLHYWFDFDFRSKWHLTSASFLTNVGDYIKTLIKLRYHLKHIRFQVEKCHLHFQVSTLMCTLPNMTMKITIRF